MPTATCCRCATRRRRHKPKRRARDCLLPRLGRRMGSMKWFAHVHIANLRALRIAREQRDRPRLIEFRTFQHKELSMKQRVATVLLWMFTIALPTAASAQHGDHGAMSPDQIGTASVKFETSCAP